MTMKRLMSGALAGVLLLGAGVRAAHAQGGERYVLIVQGASGEDQYATLHRKWVNGLVEVLRTRFKYDASHLVVLAEQPSAGELRATADSLKAAVGKLAATIKPSDQLVVVLIGHGSGQGADVKFNLVGPDLGVAEWAALLKPVPGRLALVDTTSASAPYLTGLSAPGRVIITATNTAAQRYHTVFPEGFIQAFSDATADADKNGRISLLEAFTFASRVVTQHYEQSGTMATETAMIDDDGDGKGRLAAEQGPDGRIAALTYLDGVAVPTSSDPELQRLLVRQQQLTEQVDDLRRRKDTMPAEEFDKQLEQLLTELARVSREVRSKTPAPR
ncbi:MAG: hypothetical protein IT184_10135 [Acidobacteria bacterium]|nr:hypothetical protein [Acidobacteriota bacterium]